MRVLSMEEKTKKKLIRFFRKFPLKRYKKGQIILRPGEEFPGIMFVKSGYVRVYRIFKDKPAYAKASSYSADKSAGKQVTLQLFRPTLYFSMIGAMTKQVNHHYFEAITPVELWVAPMKETLEYLEKEKEIKDDLMKTILSELVNMSVSMGEYITGNAYNKVAGIIKYLGERFGKTKREKVWIKFKVSHRLVASLTGLTRETVTLQMLKLKKEGIIETKKGQVAIRNEAKLEEASEGE